MSIYLPLTDEQGFLREAARDALGRAATIPAAREALDGAPRPDLWPTAVEAGWTGLLLDEDVDGAGLGPVEACLVLEACGERLADARLLGHLSATALLAAAGADAGLLAALAAGEKRAALVDGTLTHDGRALPGAREGGTLTCRGQAAGVLDAPGADVLVVVTEAGVGVVDGDQARVTEEKHYDATRSIGTVDLDGVTATALDADDPSLGRDVQRLLLAAESLGAAQAAMQMARAYAIDRQAFGRAIGSYQAIKHKLVEMLRLVENARSLVFHPGSLDDADLALGANAARLTAAAALDFASAENIFIHGGVGATWEHDASLFYRRAEVARRLAGGVDAAATAVAAALLDGSGVPAVEAGGLRPAPSVV